MPQVATPTATLTASRLTRHQGASTVLRDVSLSVGPGTRLGVVGPNGVGKSTLLKTLAGIERPDSGSMRLAPPTAVVGYLAQEHERRPDETVNEYLTRRSGVTAAERELVEAGEAMGRDDDGATERYGEAVDAWMALGADDFHPRALTMLAQLGLAAAHAELPTEALSGGQMAKVALASILLSRFSITLLDEPTNDLDFEGLERLEGFVSSMSGGLVIVSHDRAFLDRTITSVLELDEHDHGGRLFEGGWSAYLEERATARRHAEEAYAGYQANRESLLDRARRERQWATSAVRREKRKPSDNDKAQRDFRINRTEKLAARARMTERALDRIAPIDKPWEGWELRFTIEEAPRAGAVVARLEGAEIERGSFHLGPLDIVIGWGERLALVGPNGSGKTTLLAALLGRIPLAAGSRWMGPSVVIGELGQDRSTFAAPSSLLEAFVARTGLSTAEARSLMAKFGLGADHVGRAASSLSPGERTRAELAVFQAGGVNVLVLDEPTNHLDLPAIEQLEEALASYTGTLVMVSHDRRLLEAVDITRSIALSAP
jgi:ATPase subunit of ABC transporter with duplicated ATPase domains